MLERRSPYRITCRQAPEGLAVRVAYTYRVKRFRRYGDAHGGRHRAGVPFTEGLRFHFFVFFVALLGGSW